MTTCPSTPERFSTDTRMPARACLLMLLTFLGGCSLYSRPQVSVSGITLTERTDEAMALDVALEMTNRNDVPLELLRFDYAFSVDGRHVFTGRRSGEATLAARSTHAVTIPVVVPYDKVDWPDKQPPADFAYSLRGHVKYVTPGQLAELLLDLGVRRPTAGFGNDGRVTTRSVQTTPTTSAN